MPTTAVPDSTSAAWLVQQLADGRVLDAVRVAPYLSEFRTSYPGGGRDELAEFLVQAGLLSRFQAERAITGEASKLALGPYLIAEPVGSGSIGTVFRAVNRNDRKQYAVKVLPLRSLWNVKQAKNQVRGMSGLSHPAIVPFVDVDSAVGSHYLVWPYAAGVTLAKSKVPLAVPEAVRILTAMSDGLAACHALKIVHGLVKPSNVLVGSDGQPRLLDLGIGAILTENMADDESMLDTISTANAAMGMLDCCPPETAADPLVRTPAGDVYSLGCVAYFALTGRLPFDTGNAVDKVMAHQTQPPPSARESNSAVPQRLNDLILAMMAKSPADRPTMPEVKAMLTSPADPLPVAPPPARPPSDPFGPPLSRLAPPKPVTSSIVDFNLPDVPPPPPPGSVPKLPGLTPTLSEPTDMVGMDDDSSPLLDPWGPKPTAGSAVPVVLRSSAPGRKPDSEVKLVATDSKLPSPVTYTQSSASGSARKPVRVPVLPGFARSIGWYLRQFVFWRPAVDLVQVTVFGPPTVAPGESFTIQVFVHLPAAMESVFTLARAVHQTGEMLAIGYADRPATRGGDLGLHLTVANAGVARSLAQLTWRGQPQPRGFEVHIPWESHAGLSRSRLSVGVSGVLAGQFEFDLQVTPRQA